MAPQVKAYILAKIYPVPFEELFRQLSRFPEIKSAAVVTGDIDLIIACECEDTTALFRLVKALRELPFVISTKTSLILSEWERK